jgi:hypothetical protein
MKRFGCVLAVSVVVVASAMLAAAQSDSLGDYARSVRKEKHPPAKLVYTNDNLPTNTTISVVGPAAQPAEEKAAAKPADENEKPAPPKDAKEAKSAEKPTPQTDEEWQDQIGAEKKGLADLEHELDLEQREYKLHEAAYYADAGNQLRDQKNWIDQENKYRADIADKQKQIEDAKTQLQDTEEQARKAGVASSVIQ